MDGEKTKIFDPFELFVAVLLGLGAVGGAWAAFQGDLWGGQSQESYGEAATETTRASTAFNLGVTVLMRDIQVDIDAKSYIVEGLLTEDEATRTRAFTLASYLYAQQMSDEGYRALGLPERYRTAEGREGEAHMPADILAGSLTRELAEDEAFVSAVLRDGVGGFEGATRRFDVGRQANETGDKFGLIGVLFTVALFLAGLALVFKSRVRWAFAGLGSAMLVASCIYLFAVPWAGGGGDEVAVTAPAGGTGQPAAPAAPPAPGPAQGQGRPKRTAPPA